LKCTKIVQQPGSAQTRGGAYSDPPDPLAGFRGCFTVGECRMEKVGESEKMENKEKRGKRREEGKERGGG